MTKILLICHDIPSMSVGATLPFYHMIRNLSTRYILDLICFDSKEHSIKFLEKHLNKYTLLDLPVNTTFTSQLKHTLKNMLSMDNIKTRSFFNYYYTPLMNSTIKDTVANNDYDLIITDMPMAFYTKNIKIPKIAYAFDAVGDYNHQMYKKAKGLSKIYWYLNYLKIHNYEKIYNKFDACIVVNRKDKNLLEKFIKTPIFVVPNGVDVEYFKLKSHKYQKQLVFLGDMSTPPNNDAVHYFMDEIYPQIEDQIDFKIIGRKPSEYIKTLKSNPHLTVTGAVDDIRDYLNPGNIFISPMVSGTGIKNKILEAMSMKLAVISTSKGISGINAKDGRDFLCANTPDDFKRAILNLINDDALSCKIAENGRVYVKNNYSWNITTDKLVRIIQKTI